MCISYSCRSVFLKAELSDLFKHSVLTSEHCVWFGFCCLGINRSIHSPGVSINARKESARHNLFG